MSVTTCTDLPPSASQAVSQTEELGIAAIGRDLSVSYEPIDAEEWRGLWMPATYVDHDEHWALIKGQSSISFLGRTSSASYLAAICVSKLEWLRRNQVPFRPVQDGEPVLTLPTFHDHGIDEAIRERHHCLINHVIQEIRGRNNPRFDHCMRRMSDETVALVIQWAMLWRDIENAKPPARPRMCWHLHLLLHEESTVVEALHRNNLSLLRELPRICERHARNPQKNTSAERHKISLLRRILHWAETSTSLPSDPSDLTMSLGQDRAVLRSLFNLEGEDTTSSVRITSNSHRFERELCVSLLSGQSILMRDSVPPHLLENLTYETIILTQNSMSRLGLNYTEPEAFLWTIMKHCSKTVMSWLVVRRWIEHAAEAADIREKIKDHLRQPQIPELACMKVSILLMWENFYQTHRTTVVQPSCGSYLEDFDSFLGDREVGNREEIFRKMILSMQRVLQHTHLPNSHPRSWLFLEAKGPVYCLHILDSVSDAYWRWRLLTGTSHEFAMYNTRRSLRLALAAIPQHD